MFLVLQAFGKVLPQLNGKLTGRGVNVQPNSRTRHELDTYFFGLGLGLNGFGL